MPRPSFLRGFGFDGAADIFESMDGLYDNLFSESQQAAEDEVAAEKDRQKKSKKGKKKAKGKGQSSKAKKGKGKQGVDPSRLNTLADEEEEAPKKKPKAKPKRKAKAQRAKQGKLGSFAKGLGKGKGGFFKSLLKGPASKLLGRVAAPVTALMGAANIASTLTDDSLSSEAKTKQVGAAAGGMGGALAGAAAGAAMGSVIPVFGTAIGGLIGGALGAFGGESLGESVGGLVSGLFGDDENAPAETSQSPQAVAAKTALTGKAAAIDSSGLAPAKVTALNRQAANKTATMPDSAAARSAGASVTVNAEITVNAAPGMDEQKIAEQIKQQLEDKEREALRGVRLRYMDEVA